MIHYHGLPITPNDAALSAISGGHAFVSYRYPEQSSLAIDTCQSFAVDNGAFSAWKAGSPVRYWRPYYEWVETVCRFPGFDFAVIPDVIDGTERQDDHLVDNWPHGNLGSPVWHMHETIDRLMRLCEEWPRVCLGSSGRYATVGTRPWKDRMAEAMNAVTIEGLPVTKLHGLRMLNPRVFTRLPLNSCDSTNIARNIGIDKAWRGTYTPPSKSSRARLLRERIESHNGAPYWEGW